MTVKIPQRPRAGVVLAEREAVLDRAGRTVLEAAVAVEPPKRRDAGRPSQAQQRPQRGRARKPEQGDADLTGKRREIEPQAEPGQGQEQEQDQERQPQGRPGALPPQDKARPSNETIEPFPPGAAPGSRRAAAAGRAAGGQSARP